jgi:hypothetical protein
MFLLHQPDAAIILCGAAAFVPGANFPPETGVIEASDHENWPMILRPPEPHSVLPDPGLRFERSSSL